MKINMRQIYEGWRNSIFPPSRLKDEIKRVARQRRYICDGCDYNSRFHSTIRPDIHCIKCGCTLSAKVRCLSCDCPLEVPRWKAVLTEEEEEEIEKKK